MNANNFWKPWITQHSYRDCSQLYSISILHFSWAQKFEKFKIHLIHCSSIQIMSTSYSKYRVQVKCTLVQALRLCTGLTAHRRSRGIALLFLDYDTRREWEVNVTPRPLLTPRKDTVPIVQEAGWTPELVWTREENLASIGIRSPDRPARNQSLYSKYTVQIKMSRLLHTIIF